MSLVDWIGTRWWALADGITWDGLIVGAFVLVAAPLLRRVSPRLALGLSLVALLKFVMPPVISWPLAVVDWAAGAPLLFARSVDPDRTLLAGLALVHAGGAIAGLVALRRRQADVQALVDSGTPVADERVHEVWRDCARALGMRRMPALLAVATLDEPLAARVRRPVVLIPGTLLATDADPRMLREVLAHELAHHRHRDLAIEYFVALVSALWWWHPAVRALAVTVRELREQRADEAVIDACIVDAGTYCETLVRLARTHAALPAAFTGGATGHLRSRVRRILAPSPGLSQTWEPWIALPVILAFALAALPNA